MDLSTAARAWIAVLRLRRGLCGLPFSFFYLRLVAANQATNRGTGHRMMPRHMTHNTAHRGALDTAVRTRNGRQREDRYQDCQ